QEGPGDEAGGAARDPGLRRSLRGPSGHGISLTGSLGESIGVPRWQHHTLLFQNREPTDEPANG
ncbi:MAG: hypothetical protein ABIP13_02205, partial [Tepidiformaceae bacterium]